MSMQIPSTLDKRFIPRNFDSVGMKTTERVKNFATNSGYRMGQTNSSIVSAFRYQKKQPVEINTDEDALGIVA